MSYKSIILTALGILSPVSVWAQPVTINGKLPQLPETLGPNGGIKIECLSGCAGSGGSGGTVDQGTAISTSDANAWPFKIVFGDTHIDPRDISDRVGRSLGQITFASPQHIICDSGCGSGGGGTQDVNIISSGITVPVSGTFWQATQPISGSVSVSNFPATQPVSGTFWQATQPISGSVSVSNFPASQAVTGTFWQATQPISGSVSVSNFPATQPVSGTFWQATQPVSGTVAATQSGTWTATPPTLTKGTQGSTGYSVQSLKDAGRTAVSLSFTTTTPTTADTVVTTLIKNSAGTAAAGAKSITAAASKTFRVTAVTAQIRTTTAALPWSVVTLRMSSTTTCTASSSVVAYLTMGGTAAAIGNVGQIAHQFPDGFELSSGGSFCISVQGNVNTNVLTFSAQGFEY